MDLDEYKRKRLACEGRLERNRRDRDAENRMSDVMADVTRSMRAWAQYRYDNTNGDGKVYDGYKAWAEAKPEGGVTMLNKDRWEDQIITNYVVLTNPDELVWCNPAPMNGGDAR